MTYPLQRGRRQDEDYRDFGDKVDLLALTAPVDAGKMQSLGRLISRSSIQYRPQQFDNFIGAILVRVAGLPDHYRRQQGWYRHGIDPESYDWHWGYWLFKAGVFTSPSEVRTLHREIQRRCHTRSSALIVEKDD